MKNESQLKSSKRGVLLRLAIFMALMISAFIIPSSALADFGYTEDSTNYTIDTGANLVFKVKRSNGDISSLIYNGTDYNGYTNKNSHVETGLGQSDVTISQPSSSVIMVKVVYGTLEQYYVARKGENNIYMFTYIADDSVTVTRYIVRLKPSLFPVLNTSNSWYSSYSTLEAKDIFTDTSTGYTYSKHYSDTRVMDYNYTGISNGNVGAYIVRSNHEKASGGPFYRSLIRDNTDVAVNIYEILYYGMAQTDVKRYGLQGPYVLAFTDGGEPSSKLYAGNLKTDWIDSLGIHGWVGSSGRGRVAGVGIKNMKSDYEYVVGFSNDEAQYWTKASDSNGYFSCTNMLPGTYTMTIYKNELAVYTTDVTVTAGGTKILNSITITDDPSDNDVTWRIGDWDGTPLEFKNGSLMTKMHPADSRVESWKGNYIVGTSDASSFPCYIFKDVNNGLIVYFRLNSEQAAKDHTLRIGITGSYIGGRIQPSVNSWTSKLPSASNQPGTRLMTIGTYRGNNYAYSFTVPASAFNTNTRDWNQLKLNVISGSNGSDYLSPAVSIDCIELE